MDNYYIIKSNDDTYVHSISSDGVELISEPLRALKFGALSSVKGIIRDLKKKTPFNKYVPIMVTFKEVD